MDGRSAPTTAPFACRCAVLGEGANFDAAFERRIQRSFTDFPASLQ
jgi:hypothetical protein